MGWKNLNLLSGGASAESIWINQSLSSWQEESDSRRCQRKAGKDTSQSASTVPSTSSTPLTGPARGNQWGRSCGSKIITPGNMRGVFRDTEGFPIYSSHPALCTDTTPAWGASSRAHAGPREWDMTIPAGCWQTLTDPASLMWLPRLGDLMGPKCSCPAAKATLDRTPWAGSCLLLSEEELPSSPAPHGHQLILQHSLCSAWHR